MKLLEFALLTDENIHPAVVVTLLRNEGCDVEDVKGSELQGSTDESLLRRAVEQQRVVITQDKDFGRLAVAANHSSHGIVYLRPGHVDPAFTIETLKLLGESPDVSPPFILVARRVGDSVRIRVRSL